MADYINKNIKFSIIRHFEESISYLLFRITHKTDYCDLENLIDIFMLNF